MKINSLLRTGLALALPISLLTLGCDIGTDDFGFSELSQAQFGLEQERSRGGFAGRSGKMQQWRDCVELSEDQEKQLEAIQASMHDELAPVKEELHLIKDDMHALWSESQPDKDAILAKHAAMREPMRQLFQGMIAYRIQAQALLTAQQKEELFACLGECGQTNQDSSNRGRGEGSCAGGEDKGEGGEGKGKGKGMFGGDRGAKEGLGLSPQQMIQAIGMLWELRNDVTDEMEQLKEMRTEMCQLWRVDEPSQEDIEAKFEQMLPPMQNLLERMVEFRIDFIEILDDEQREKLADRMSQRRERMDQVNEENDEDETA